MDPTLTPPRPSITPTPTRVSIVSVHDDDSDFDFGSDYGFDDLAEEDTRPSERRIKRWLSQQLGFGFTIEGKKREEEEDTETRFASLRHKESTRTMMSATSASASASLSSQSSLVLDSASASPDLSLSTVPYGVGPAPRADSPLLGFPGLPSSSPADALQPSGAAEDPLRYPGGSAGYVRDLPDGRGEEEGVLVPIKQSGRDKPLPLPPAPSPTLSDSKHSPAPSYSSSSGSSHGRTSFIPPGSLSRRPSMLRQPLLDDPSVAEEQARPVEATRSRSESTLPVAAAAAAAPPAFMRSRSHSNAVPTSSSGSPGALFHLPTGMLGKMHKSQSHAQLSAAFWGSAGQVQPHLQPLSEQQQPQSPLPPSSAPTRRQSRAPSVSQAQWHSQSQAPSQSHSHSPSYASSTVSFHQSLPQGQTQTQSPGARNAVYIDSERLDTLLLEAMMARREVEEGMSDVDGESEAEDYGEVLDGQHHMDVGMSMLDVQEEEDGDLPGSGCVTPSYPPHQQQQYATPAAYYARPPPNTPMTASGYFGNINTGVEARASQVYIGRHASISVSGYASPLKSGYASPSMVASPAGSPSISRTASRTHSRVPSASVSRVHSRAPSRSVSMSRVASQSQLQLQLQSQLHSPSTSIVRSPVPSQSHSRAGSSEKDANSIILVPSTAPNASPIRLSLPPLVQGKKPVRPPPAPLLDVDALVGGGAVLEPVLVESELELELDVDLGPELSVEDHMVFGRLDGDVDVDVDEEDEEEERERLDRRRSVRSPYAFGQKGFLGMPVEDDKRVEEEEEREQEQEQEGTKNGALAPPTTSRWSLTSSVDENAGGKKEKNKRRSFVNFGGDKDTTDAGSPKDTSTSTKKRGRLISFISRLSGVGVGGTVGAPLLSPPLPSATLLSAFPSHQGGEEVSSVLMPSPVIVQNKDRESPPLPPLPRLSNEDPVVYSPTKRAFSPAPLNINTSNVSGVWHPPTSSKSVPSSPASPLGPSGRARTITLGGVVIPPVPTRPVPMPMPVGPQALGKAASEGLVGNGPASPPLARRARSNSAADLLMKAPSAVASLATSTSTSNLLNFTSSASASAVGNYVVDGNPYVQWTRRPVLMKSASASLLNQPQPLRVHTHTPTLPTVTNGDEEFRPPAPLFAVDAYQSYRQYQQGHSRNSSVPGTPTSMASTEEYGEETVRTLGDDDDEEEEEEMKEDATEEEREQHRVQREKAHEERWMRVRVNADAQTLQYEQQEEMVVLSPITPTPNPTATVAKVEGALMALAPQVHIHLPPTSSTQGQAQAQVEAQRPRLKSMSSLANLPSSAASPGGLVPKAKGSSGFRGFVERMGISRGNSTANTTNSTPASSYPSTPLPTTPAVEFPRKTPSPTHSPTTSLSIGGGGSAGAAAAAAVILGKKKQPKRKLLISGVGLEDVKAYEAVKSWCESFGELREMTRAPNGSLYVDFKKASVAETVCRLQAQVNIKGAGSVTLSWSTKKKLI